MNTIIFLAISGIVVLGSGLFRLHKWLLAFSLVACLLAFILESQWLESPGILLQSHDHNRSVCHKIYRAADI